MKRIHFEFRIPRGFGRTSFSRRGGRTAKRPDLPECKLTFSNALHRTAADPLIGLLRDYFLPVGCVVNITVRFSLQARRSLTCRTRAGESSAHFSLPVQLEFGCAARPTTAGARSFRRGFLSPDVFHIFHRIPHGRLPPPAHRCL